MAKTIVYCDCSVGDPCPQGKTGFTNRCKILKNKEREMTREEAYKLLPIMEQSCTRDHFLNALEALGLLKFEEKKNVSVIFTSNYRDIRLEEWPEGLVLWVGGEVVWKSWIAYAVMGEKFPR